jgi:hypothetical protein
MRKIVYCNFIYESITPEMIPEVLYHGSTQKFDRFELGHSDLGENLNKFGYGVYLTDTEDLASYYANGKESYIYQCSIPRFSMNLIEWDDNVDEFLYRKVANSLSALGYESDAESLIEELNSYGDTISTDSLYNITKDLIGEEEASKLFIKCGVDGFVANDINNRGRIYVILDPSRIKIVDVQARV